jgi:hypothetical protein
MSYNENFKYASSGSFPSGNIVTASASGLTTALTNNTTTNVKTWTNLPVGSYVSTSTYLLTCATDASFIDIAEQTSGTNNFCNVTGVLAVPLDLTATQKVQAQFTENINMTGASNTLVMGTQPTFTTGTMTLTSWKINLTKI